MCSLSKGGFGEEVIRSRAVEAWLTFVCPMSWLGNVTFQAQLKVRICFFSCYKICASMMMFVVKKFDTVYLYVF